MSVIANLDINLRGNTQGIEKAASTSSKKLGELKGAVNSHASAVEGRFAQMKGKLGGIMSGLTSAFSLATKGIAGLAAAGVAAGASLFVMSRKESQAIDSLAKNADKIGISTEALAGLQHAANLAGVDAESLNSTLSGMVQTISKTGSAGGEAGRALARIGINIQDVQGLAPDEQFLKIAGALDQVGDKSKRLLLANEIGGESFAKIITNMKGGTEGLKSAMQEASSLGLTISRQEAAQVEASNTAMRRMQAAFTGLFRTSAIALAPFIEMAANGVADVMKWVNSFRESIMEFAVSAQFAWKHFGDYAKLAYDGVLYGAVSLVNQLEHYFVEVLPEALKAAWDAAIQAISGESIDKVVEDAYRRIKQKIAARKEGAIEANLRQTYEAASKALEAQRKRSVEQKLAAMRSSEAKKPGAGVSEVIGISHNGPAERGSQEAFAVIAGYQKDKMLQKANEQLTELRKTNKLLDKLLNKRAGAALGRGRV